MVSEMSICIIKTVGQLDMVTVISDRQLFTKNSGIGHESLYDIYIHSGIGHNDWYQK